MYVIQAWPAHGDTELHKSFFVSSTLAMEACYSSLCDHVAGTMEKPDEIKWDYDGFTGAYVGTTEYGIDYEIYRLNLDSAVEHRFSAVSQASGQGATCS